MPPNPPPGPTPTRLLLAHMIEQIDGRVTEQGYRALSLTLTGHRADGGTETIEIPWLVPFNDEHYLGWGIVTGTENARLPGEGYEERGPGPHLPVMVVYGWEAQPLNEGDPAYSITVQRTPAYLGYPDGTVAVVNEDGSESMLPHLSRHSPTGFGWGYAGSGPADLARSILVHATGDEVSEAEYMAFKFGVVTQMPAEGWGLPQHAVRTWHEQWQADNS